MLYAIGIVGLFLLLLKLGADDVNRAYRGR